MGLKIFVRHSLSFIVVQGCILILVTNYVLLNQVNHEVDNTERPLNVLCTPSSLASSSYLDSGNGVNWIPKDQIQFCRAKNFINMYHDQLSFRTTNNSRPYSIHPLSFRRHHSRFCETSMELRMAIKKGTRLWGDDVPSSTITIEQRELLPSYFVPFGCDIPYLSPNEFCETANLFQHILIQGDSQSRHLHQAMTMIYRNDVIQGSIQPPFTNLTHQHRCHCDAQFSPSNNCRPLDIGRFKKFRPSQLHTCHFLPIENQVTHIYSENRDMERNNNFDDINCSAPDYKGILIYIQGGVHYKWNAKSTVQWVWRKIIKNAIVRECAKQRKLTFIWSGYMAQSPFLDSLFKEQAMPNGLIFEKEMRQILKKRRLVVPSLDWINLTLGSAKADGLHFMTDVNLERAQHLMILAKMLRMEQHYQTL
jgi:hypothetical protein